MYLWDTDGLAEDLKAGRVPQRDKAIYLLAWLVFPSINMFFVWLVNPLEDYVVWIAEAVTTTLINTGGLLFCYRANRRGDDRDFIDRVISLGWPVTVRMTALYWCVASFYLSFGFEVVEAAEVSFRSVLGVVFYVRLRAHMLRVSGARELSSQEGEE